MTKDKNRQANQVLADMEFFDYLKEKVGDRKTKTGAYHDLLEKCAAGFVAPFLKNHEYVLQADQCHVTITDLAVEWHWHRATVRTFLDKLEDMGHIHRTRFAKSVVITMAFNKCDIGNTTAPYNDQARTRPSDEMDVALSKWITGNLSDLQMGDICEQYYGVLLKQAADGSHADGFGNETFPADKSTDGLNQELVERIAMAALKRTIRNSRFDNPAAFIDFFNRKLAGDWSSLLEASRKTAQMLLFGEDGIADDASGEEETLLALRKPFKALLAEYLERTLPIL
jgi:hypothetical protein